MNKLALVCFVLAVIVGYSLYQPQMDPVSVAGKVVIVTGASTGIGEQIAYHYARLGAKLLITARREKQLQQVISKCQEVGSSTAEYHYVVADMSVPDDAKRVIDAAVERYGRLDTLVLNHIMVHPLGHWEGSAANLTLFDKILDVNFKAYVRLTSHALEPLKKSKGSITVVSSIAGRISQPFLISYSGTKFALDGFFSGLRQELAIRETGVSVTLCIIGLVGTENAINNLKDFGLATLLNTIPIGDPSEAALAIVEGGALRLREVYYPYMEARFSTLLRNWIPGILEGIMSNIYTQS